MKARAAGFSLLEVMVATAVLSVLLLGATELVLTGQQAYAQGTGQAYVRGEAQKALDQCVKDVRGAAAWTIATASGPVAGEAGSTITPLTAWNETTNTLSCSFGPRPNVLFFRAVDAQVVPGATPPYLVLDFEPKGLGTGGVVQDVGADGTTLAGRMNDDQLKARVLLRTRVADDRVLFERVLAPVADVPTDGTLPLPESAITLADLGPATMPAGATPGALSFETTAPGVVRIKVTARAFVDVRGQRTVVSAEIATTVALTVLAPPH